MSEENELRAEIERLRAKVEAIETHKDRTRLKVSEKGALSLYGIRRFPVTFYADEWETRRAARFAASLRSTPPSSSASALE